MLIPMITIGSAVFVIQKISKGKTKEVRKSSLRDWINGEEDISFRRT